ncbi:phenylacetate--CoA ligase family protein [Halobaculum marinum]|uniref:Phenylacetate--CoA ligase family protein n=1 Tax=Halobaculum marinum TaxID=3031996 RepID=A0ABD5X3R9_9EURY
MPSTAVGGSELGQVAATLDVWRAKWASRAAIDARRRRRLDRHLAFVRRQSRFYARHWADVPEGTTDLRAYPPVTKPTLMANFDDVVTDTAVTKAGVDAFVADESTIGERFLGRYPVWLTSGTTGEPGVFLHDDLSLRLINVLPDRWIVGSIAASPTALTRFLRNGARAAEIAVTGGHFAGASGVALMERESTLLHNRGRLLSPTRPIDELIQELEAFQPAILVGYATVLVELARAQRAGRLHIDPAFVGPTAEPITNDQKRDLREAFGCVVRELYGSTECFPLAVECERGNLHANTDWFVVEPVDDDYEPVPAGEPSDTVLVTNLGNRIMPLVRYDLGDSVTMHDWECPCGSGFPVLEVEGRQGSVLQFETDAGASVPVFPLALSTVVEEVPGVRRAQVVRTGERTLRVHLDVTGDADPGAVRERVDTDLTAFFADQGVADLTVEHAEDPPARVPTSGKFRHVWSEYDD